MPESEKTIEKHVVNTVKQLGGVAIKGNTVNSRGYPDRIILFPGSKIGFLEVKSQGRSPTKLQQHWLDLLSGMGFKTGYADTKAKADKFIKELYDADS